MEDIRRRIMAKDGALDLFPAKSRPQKPSDIISISSTESSPTGSESNRNKGQNIPRPTQVIDLDSDTSYGTAEGSIEVSPQPIKPKTIAKQKHLIWESDSDEGTPPPFPVAQPAKLPAPTFPEPQLPPNPLVPSRKPYAPFPLQTGSSEKRVHDLEEPAPIRMPWTIPPPPFRPTGSGANKDGALWESFDDAGTEHLYDPRTSAADAERHLQDLVQQSMNDTNENIDMTLATVKGFKESFKLLPHQVVGRTWMSERESGKSHGGILADDMGLGKTIQTLTRIIDGRPRRSDRDDGYAATTLVVCPVGLVSQWASEIARIAVGLRVLEHHGQSRTKDPEVLKHAHVVVTSYSIVSSEHGAFDKTKDESKGKKKKAASDSSDSDDSDNFARSVPKKSAASGSRKKPMDALFHVNWWRIVLDEAHNIKNRKTKAAIACCALKGKFRWCLTGTPMQNNVEELFSLLQFLRIRPLNNWETFNDQINKPVKSGRSVRAMKRLHVVLKAIMLRRKKDTILNGQPLIKLPERIVEVVECQFDADEREFYEAIENKVELTLNKFMKAGEMSRNYTSMLVLLLRLRQACNHPSLISKDVSFDREAVEPKAVKEGNDLDDDDELTDMFGKLGVSGTKKCGMCQATMTSANTSGDDAKYCDDCTELATKARRKSLATEKGTYSSLPPESAKTRMIMDLLEDIRERDEEEKTIIFSQFTSMLDIIQPFLRDAGIRFVRYDGSMRKDQREESLEKIRNSSSIKVILISFKAGSTGLNLTACNNVILVDLWWNPALEDQAFDRAHRLGQTRKVNIYKLTIEHTVEARILALQEKKRELAAAALSGDKIKNSKLAMDDLMALFQRHGRDEDESD